MAAEVPGLMTAQLLFLPDGRTMLPVSPAAFTVAQGPRKELEKYVGAIVVSVSGVARTIVSIRASGPWGQSAVRRLLSRLTSAWSISVELSAARALPLGELKSLVTRGLAGEPNDSDSLLGPLGDREAVLARVLEAQESSAVFEAIGLPPIEDCLDVL